MRAQTNWSGPAARTTAFPAAQTADYVELRAVTAYQGASPAFVPVPARTSVSGVTTAITPRSAASANAPWPSSNADGSCGGHAGGIGRVTGATHAIVALKLATGPDTEKTHPYADSLSASR